MILVDAEGENEWQKAGFCKCQYKKLTPFDMHQKLLYLADLQIMVPIREKLDSHDSALLCAKLIERIQVPARQFASRIARSLASEDLYDARLEMADMVLQGDEYGKFLFSSGGGGGSGDGGREAALMSFFATCLEHRDRIGALVSKYGPQIVVALERFPLPDNADEMDDTARLKHARMLNLGRRQSFKPSTKLKPEEVARRLRIGKLYHEFEYSRTNGSKRDQFFAANPDCVLGERLMTTAVAAYKKS